jgi:hypothetical protein
VVELGVETDFIVVASGMTSKSTRSRTEFAPDAVFNDAQSDIAYITQIYVIHGNKGEQQIRKITISCNVTSYSLVDTCPTFQWYPSNC